jgi:signal transduction histidine kinase/streptogramin lyase
VVARTYSQKDGLPSTWTNAIRQTSDGTLWVATDGGLAKLDAGAAERTALFQAYKKSQGLCTKVFSFLEERDGNLWVGTDCGLIKVARGGVVRYTQDDGLAGSNSVAIFTTRAGELMVVSSNEKGEHWLNRFAEGKFTAVRPNLTKGYQGWGWGQLYVNDRAGQWWMPSNRSLFRFPKVNDISQLARVSPKAIYAGREFGTDSEVFRVYEDSRGDIWIMTTGERTLFKWDRRTEELRDYTNEVDHRWAVSFTEDRAGNLWLGTTQRTEGRLMRYKDDRFTMFTQSDGAPRGWIGALYVDHAGRLWIASTLDGVARVDDPSAEHPVFVRYDRSSGLSTNGASCLNEDQFGRIYIGTGRGLDRLDPATGRIKHFTSADGLPQGGIVVACRDSQGAIWFGGEQGLARVIPEPDRAHQPPNVLLTGVRAGGIAETVSEFGEPTVAPLELSSSQTQVSVDFIGLGASLGEDLKYQYQFEGASDWSAPIVQRTVDFANLAPGSYHFFVRAINSDGLFSETPASFAFTIASPIWKRWWFIALATMLTCGIAYAAYRYRVAQLIKLERVRMRIATDLHDDIGSSLSQIAILSEVARHDLRDGSAAGEPLSVIAQTSRELVDSMSDIVWAINPKRDSLRDLVQRMRGFATDVLTAKDIDFEFNAPENSESLKLDTDVRREVFLIFKESVNNIVRHSQSEKADIRFGLRQGSLVLQVIDWGKGFDTDLESGGHGLFSMRQRARNIDGDLSITSVRGRGSTVTLRVPLSVQHRGSSLKKHLPE